MSWGRWILNGIASLFFAALGTIVLAVFREMSFAKTAGLAAVAGGLPGFLLWPAFIVFGLLFLLLFYATGRLKNKPLRIVFFWIPTVLSCALGGMLLMLFLYFLRPASIRF
jgi:hypothetical protein